MSPKEGRLQARRRRNGARPLANLQARSPHPPIARWIHGQTGGAKRPAATDRRAPGRPPGAETIAAIQRRCPCRCAKNASEFWTKTANARPAGGPQRQSRCCTIRPSRPPPARHARGQTQPVRRTSVSQARSLAYCSSPRTRKPTPAKSWTCLARNPPLRHRIALPHLQTGQKRRPGRGRILEAPDA